MAGQLFMVVGPSGVGKDTLIDAALLECSHISRIKRVVTRNLAAGGEDITSVSREQFDKMEARGDFAFSWHSHALSYGIPKEIHIMLEAGQSLIFNGSRSFIDTVTKAVPTVKILSIEADIELLKERLVTRGRETAGDIERRLDRASVGVADGPNVTRILNNASLNQSAKVLIKVLSLQGENA
tara:strand:+ start:31 stop:579 length:549 start_codon:yes stop_codon:yes gene_type:complete